MSDLDTPPALKAPPPQPLLPAPDRDTAEWPSVESARRRRSGRRLLGFGVLLLFAAALALGVWRHYQQHRQVMDTAEQRANFFPGVRVEAGGSRRRGVSGTLPA